nr:MAG TPA: hypothetical protein [Caudoviricetes sp.]
MEAQKDRLEIWILRRAKRLRPGVTFGQFSG